MIELGYGFYKVTNVFDHETSCFGHFTEFVISFPNIQRKECVSPRLTFHSLLQKEPVVVST